MSVLRLWFVPGDGIDRVIISSNIQRYLGNDATVRPGTGTEEFEGKPGYWIRAERNLTTSQLQDLQRDSAKYRSNQGGQQPQQPPRRTNDPYGAPAPREPLYGRAGPHGGDSPIGMDIDYPERRAPGYDDRRPDRGYPPRDAGYPPASTRPPYENYDDPYDRYRDRRGGPQDRHDVDRAYPPRGHDDRAYPPRTRGPYDDGQMDYTGDYRPNLADPYGYDQRAYQSRPTVPGAAPPLGYNIGPPNAAYPPRAEENYYPPQGAGYPPRADDAAYSLGYGAPINPPVQPPFGANLYGAPPAARPREDERRQYGNSGDYSPDSTSRDSRDGRERYAYPSPPVTVVARPSENALNASQSSQYPPAGPNLLAQGFPYDGRAAPPLPVSTFPAAAPVFSSTAMPGTVNRPRQGQRLDDMDIEPPRQRARRS